MKVGVCGLGLIGGSMARAYKNAGHTVFGFDSNPTTLGYARLAEICDGVLDGDTTGDCDLIFIALYPHSAVDYIRSISAMLKKTCTVIDLCGTKKRICDAGFEEARKYGFVFVGGHPMAGTQYSGIKYSRSNLFRGAPMVIVPPAGVDMAFLDCIKKLLEPAGFGKISITTAENHDRMIAFTSQLAHIVSNAYVKSPTAGEHHGFSAGSYRDLTRVAWLNENMWTELFLENRENVIAELDCIIGSLTEYRDAVGSNDAERLCGLLRDGRIAKEKTDSAAASK